MLFNFKVIRQFFERLQSNLTHVEREVEDVPSQGEWSCSVARFSFCRCCADGRAYIAELDDSLPLVLISLVLILGGINIPSLLFQVLFGPVPFYESLSLILGLGQFICGGGIFVFLLSGFYYINYSSGDLMMVEIQRFEKHKLFLGLWMLSPFALGLAVFGSFVLLALGKNIVANAIGTLGCAFFLIFFLYLHYRKSLELPNAAKIYEHADYLHWYDRTKKKWLLVKKPLIDDKWFKTAVTYSSKREIESVLQEKNQRNGSKK